MRGKKSIASLAMLALVGSLFGCGKIEENKDTQVLESPTIENKVIAPDSLKVVAIGNETIKTNVATKADLSSTINLTNGEQGKVTLTKLEGQINDEVKVFVRPDFGYQPKSVKHNNVELDGFEGNYAFLLKAGVNNVVVEYEPIKAPLETPVNYDAAYARLAGSVASNPNFLTDNGDSITLNSAAIYREEATVLQFAGNEVSLKIPKTYTDGKIDVSVALFDDDNRNATYTFKIDSHTYSNETLLSEVDMKVAISPLLTPTLDQDTFYNEQKEYILKSVDSTLQRFIRKKVSTIDVNFFDLGFYNYPGYYKVNYQPEEFVNESTPFSYATEIAKIRNYIESIETEDPLFFGQNYRIRGVHDVFIIKNVDDFYLTTILLFDDKIRISCTNNGYEGHLDSFLNIMSIDLPYDLTTNISLKGFLTAGNDDNFLTKTNESLQINYDFELERNFTIDKPNFEHISVESFKKFIVDGSYQYDKTPFSTHFYELATSFIMNDFKNFICSFYDHDLINPAKLELVEECTLEEREPYSQSCYQYDAEKANKIYNAWHADFLKIINSLAGKDPSSTEKVDLVLLKGHTNKPYQLGAREGKILISKNNQNIQFGIRVEVVGCGNTDFLFAIPNTNRTENKANFVMKVTHENVDHYYHAKLDLDTLIEFDTSLFKEYDKTYINDDLSLKENALLKGESLFSLETFYSAMNEGFNLVLNALFREFGNNDLIFSFGFKSFVIA